MSRLDWALWPEARASCIADDEVDCGVPSAPRSGPGCDAWCVSSRDRCSRPVAWHRPPPEPCHGSALSADDRALPGVQPHPKPAPAWSGGAVERLAAYGDTTWPAAHREHDRRLLDQRFRPTPELWFAKIVNSGEMKPMAGAPKGLEFVQAWHHDSPS